MATEVKVIEEVKGTLMTMQDSFAASLPKHIPAERFVRAAQTAIMTKPELLGLDRQSLYSAVAAAAQDGLLPDGRESAIVPFKGKAKFMPMVAGICKKARNSGEIAAIDSVVVYEADEYAAWLDEKGWHFKYVKSPANRGKVVLTFAYAIGKDGTVFFEEVDEEQMAKIEAKSTAGSDSPWKGSFKDEMRRKSAIRRLAKYKLPSSSDIDSLFKHDNEFYEEPSAEEVAATRGENTSPQRLGKIIEAQAEVVDETPKPAAPIDQAKKVFPAAREVNKPATAQPAAVKPAAAKPSAPKLSITGKITDIKVIDSTDPAKPWRRFAIKVNEKLYGTFDKKIGETLSDIMDSGREVKITYTERVKDAKLFRDIEALEVIGGDMAEGEGDVVSEGEVPI